MHLYTYTWAGTPFNLFHSFIVSTIHLQLEWVKKWSTLQSTALPLLWRSILPGLRLQMYCLRQNKRFILHDTTPNQNFVAAFSTHLILCIYRYLNVHRGQKMLLIYCVGHWSPRGNVLLKILTQVNQWNTQKLNSHLIVLWSISVPCTVLSSF